MDEKHLMKGVIFMNKKEISVILTKNKDNNIILNFNFNSGKLELNLESNNSEEIKSVFMKLAKELRELPLDLNYSIDDKKIDKKEDGLFIDAAEEYINQLKEELLTIENDSDLKILRDKKEHI